MGGKMVSATFAECIGIIGSMIHLSPSDIAGGIKSLGREISDDPKGWSCKSHTFSQDVAK
jgi:hypothetical protein